MSLRKASAEAQHHDAVDGTSPGRITAMWIHHLAAAEATASNASADTVEALLRTGSSSITEGLSADGAVLGVGLAGNLTVPVVVYNSLGFDRTQVLTLPIPAAALDLALLGGGGIKVTAADGTVVPSQLRIASLPADVWPGGKPSPQASKQSTAALVTSLARAFMVAPALQANLKPT